MHEDVRSAETLHTKVCEVERHLLGSYRALITHEIDKQRLTISALAEQTGYNRYSLARMIKGEQELRCRDIITICAAIGIDRLYASYAIEKMGDWECYYDVSLAMILSLVKPVLSKIMERSKAPMEPLSPAAAEMLAEKVAEKLIQNQADIYDRRERLVDPRF